MRKPIVDIALVRGSICRTADAIAGDLEQMCQENGEKFRNIDLLEACIDANRLTTFAYGTTKADAIAAEAEITRAIEAHGYMKVLRALNREIQLI